MPPPRRGSDGMLSNRTMAAAAVRKTAAPEHADQEKQTAALNFLTGIALHHNGAGERGGADAFGQR